MFLGATTFNLDWAKSFFPRFTGYSANPPYWRVRIMWENDRLPGFRAYTDPHSVEAQAYADVTNQGIAFIMNNSGAIDAAYAAWKGTQTTTPPPSGGGTTLPPPGGSPMPPPPSGSTAGSGFFDSIGTVGMIAGIALIALMFMKK